MPGVKKMVRSEMYDVIGTIPELDDCNIIAFHLLADRKGKTKISIIADNALKEIIKVDIFIRNDDLAWEIERGL